MTGSEERSTYLNSISVVDFTSDRVKFKIVFADAYSITVYFSFCNFLTLFFNFQIFLQVFSHRPWYQPFLEFANLYQWACEACDLALNSTVVKNLVNTKPKYDVILMEQFNADCMMAVAWKLKAPVIALSSCVLMPWHYDRFGSPWMLSHMTGQPMGFSSHMTYTERLLNFFYMNLYKIMYK